MVSVDFLPICDILFNFISLASYFCDVAFDIIVAYTFFRDGLTFWFLIVLAAIIVSLCISQTLSIKWFIEDEEHQGRTKTAIFYIAHALQCGVLWRYCKLLFLPMGSAIPLVKREMRNLCVIRMVHAFVQGIPLLIVQGYIMATQTHVLSEVHSVSTVLSLFNICWALASFNKNIRNKDIDKLVLTWIGVIFQLLWRLGTVSSRILAIVFYASAFNLWIFLVLVMHWLCMFMWLIFQQYQNEDASSSEVMGKTAGSKVFWSFILSYVHNYAYLNVESNKNSSKTKLKVAIFYFVTLVENVLLIGLWMTSVRASLDYTPEQRRDVVMTVVLAFFGGLFFMMLYYRLFHTSKISSAFQREDYDDDEAVAAVPGKTQTSSSSDSHNSLSQLEKMGINECSNNQAVFNCMLNPALKKKKKIPSVLPPPPAKTATAPTPFWKEPLPDRATTPLHEIKQKLQTKHESQLKKLRLIENEIRSGQIERPSNSYHVGGGGDIIVRHDPGVKTHQPYLHINDPLNDSSGDQGDVDSADDGGHLHHQSFVPQLSHHSRRREFRLQQSQRQYETPL